MLEMLVKVLLRIYWQIFFGDFFLRQAYDVTAVNGGNW